MTLMVHQASILLLLINRWSGAPSHIISVRVSLFDVRVKPIPMWLLINMYTDLKFNFKCHVMQGTIVEGILYQVRPVIDSVV